MTKRQTPPARKSNACVVVVKPFGPHHCARCFGSLHAANTSVRGALSTRVPLIARGSLSRSRLFLSAPFRLPGPRRLRAGRRLGLQDTQIVVETVETLLPKTAIILEPVVSLLQRLGLNAARPHLCVASARDEAGTLQHFEVLGNRRQAHFERLRQFRHRGLAERESREDRAPRRIGESSERGAKAIGRHVVF